MKRMVLSIAITFLAVFVAAAQDIIVMRNSTQVQAKIRNISQTEITYSRWSNLDGPTYTINKSDVSYIQYANGEKDVFDAASAPQSGSSDYPAAGSYSSGGNYSGTGNYSASGNYSGTGSYSASGSNSSSNGYSASYGNNVGTTAGITNALGTLGSAAFGGSSDFNSGSSLYVDNDYDDKLRRARRKKGWGTGLLAFGATYFGILAIGAIAGEMPELLVPGAVLGVPSIIVGSCLLGAGNRAMRKLNNGISYAPAFEYPIQFENVALVPSMGVTNDLTMSRQSLSAGIALRF